MTAPQLPLQGSGLRPGAGFLVATIVISARGLLVYVIQLDNALDGRIRDRTPLGLSLMSLGFLGPAVAMAAIRRRQALGQKGLREWGSLTLFPGSFLILWTCPRSIP